jgi:hypothetical protein
MSRHLFDADLANNPIRVTVGYDRPTNQFYLVVGWVDPKTNSVFAYASELQLAYDPNDLRSIRRFLDKLGITAPESVWSEVAYDSAAQIGSRVVRHLSDGTMRELMAG